jgi:hypothetical protein
MQPSQGERGQKKADKLLVISPTTLWQKLPDLPMQQTKRHL